MKSKEQDKSDSHEIDNSIDHDSNKTGNKTICLSINNNQNEACNTDRPLSDNVNEDTNKSVDIDNNNDQNIQTKNNEEDNVAMVNTDDLNIDVDVGEDHQALSKQVNEYFQHIKNYTSSNVSVDGDDVDVEEVVNDVVNSVDFGVDLDLNIDSLTNYVNDNNQNITYQVESSIKKALNTSTHASLHSHIMSSLEATSNIINDKLQTNLQSSSKNQCQFCGKTFQQAGSLGRHLDTQKGNELHPVDEIEKIRSNVARRGNPDAVKARRQKRSKEYNRREYVKEKNRIRRKATSKLSRVKESYQMKFYRKISHPVLPSHPSFPRLVLFFLPPNTWPHDPPTTQTFKTLVMWLEKNNDVRSRVPFLNEGLTINGCLEKLSVSFESWQKLSTEDKKDMWNREQRVILQQSLGNLTVFDFAIRDNWAKHLMHEKKYELSNTTNSENNNLEDKVDSDENIDENHDGIITNDKSEDNINHLQQYYTNSQNETDDETNEYEVDNKTDDHQMGQLAGIEQLNDNDSGHADEVDDQDDVKLAEANLVAVAAAAAAAAATSDKNEEYEV